MVRVVHRVHVRVADVLRDLRRAVAHPAEDPGSDDERPHDGRQRPPDETLLTTPVVFNI